MITEQQLKPCPFCGETEELIITCDAWLLEEWFVVI